MGTVISVDVRDASLDPDSIDRVMSWFHDVDERFSTYRGQSEVCRLSAGELRRDDISTDMRQVLALCDEVHRESNGAFDAWHRGEPVRLDPSAVVKGWSVDRAAALLDAAGGRNFCINAGGDVLTRGQPEPGRSWRVGVRHPHQGDKVAVVIRSVDNAVATSGAYERGAHIVDPRTGETPSELLSITVVGPSLARADAYSTAAYVLGRAGVGWVGERSGYDAYGITVHNRVVSTSGFAIRTADAASGATDTSDDAAPSVQAALDQAQG